MPSSPPFPPAGTVALISRARKPENPPAPDTPAPTAAGETPPTIALPYPRFAVGSLLVLLAGAGAAVVASRNPATPPDTAAIAALGLGAFAVLYVLAQALERIVEVLAPLVELLLSKARRAKGTAKPTTRQIRDVARANLAEIRGLKGATGTDADELAKAEAANTTADARATTSSAVLKSSINLAIGVPLIVYFQFSIMAALGFTGFAAWVDQVLTATAIVGGSAGLHDLITKLQAKPPAADPPA